MTFEQNVRAILESNFAGFKDEIIDIACKRIYELTNPYDRVLKIIDENENFMYEMCGSSLVDPDAIREAVKALKEGGEE